MLENTGLIYMICVFLKQYRNPSRNLMVLQNIEFPGSL